jgi:hypothetical protein
MFILHTNKGDTMGTKREYAISLGLATPGRGRLSREAHAAIDKAIAEGMTFSDATAKPVIQKPQKVAREPQKRAVATEESHTTMADIHYRYDVDQLFVGTDSHGKKHTVNARQVCRNCGYSLTSHICHNPEVLVSSLEHIPVTPK